MTDPPKPESREIPIVWVEPEDNRVQWANQFVSSFQSGEFVVTMGQVSPPPITGKTDEERRVQIDQIAYVPVQIVAKVALTRQRMVELIDVLQRNLKSHDEVWGEKS